MTSASLNGNPVTILVGDVRERLRDLPDACIDTVVTSPPYFGLRDYGTGSWEGGDPSCSHEDAPRAALTAPAGSEKQASNHGANGVAKVLGACSCGATRVDRQIGLEPTPADFVEALVAVFAEIHRVLAPHGTVWLNLGDSYASAPPGNAPDAPSGISQTRPKARQVVDNLRRGQRGDPSGTAIRPPSFGLPQKNLIGIPWRVAFALQDAGWILRSEVIWAKPNPMPESVEDRPTRSHETLFLLTKRPRYYFDAFAVREESAESSIARRGLFKVPGAKEMLREEEGLSPGISGAYGYGRNVRTVWEIATQPYRDAHFATYPEALVERCLLATGPRRVCQTCGRPRERILERPENVHPGDSGRNDVQGLAQRGTRDDGLAIGTVMRERFEAGREPRTLGWTDCGHGDYRPGRVLDPFLGSGTTGVVARRLGLSVVGTELNPDYARMARARIARFYVKPRAAPPEPEGHPTLFEIEALA